MISRRFSRILAALFWLVWLPSTAALADQLTSSDSGGTATLGSDFVITGATLGAPGGTLSLSCQATSMTPGYPYAAEWSCSGGSYSLVSSDGLTSVKGSFTSGLLTEEITGGGRGDPRFYWYAFSGNFTGTMTRNGAQQPITGSTSQTLAELRTPLGAGTIAAGVGSANSILGPFYVSDTYNNRLVHVDDMLGDGWMTFGAAGSGVGQFEQPWGMAVDANGRIYVADSGNNRIVRIDDLSGSNWTVLGTLGSGVKQFNYPHGIWVDASGRIYVCDGENGRIVSMDDMTGKNWQSYGKVGSGIGQFTQPTGITLDASGRIYVADAMNISAGAHRRHDRRQLDVLRQRRRPRPVLVPLGRLDRHRGADLRGRHGQRPHHPDERHARHRLGRPGRSAGRRRRSVHQSLRRLRGLFRDDLRGRLPVGPDRAGRRHDRPGLDHVWHRRDRAEQLHDPDGDRGRPQDGGAGFGAEFVESPVIEPRPVRSESLLRLVRDLLRSAGGRRDGAPSDLRCRRPPGASLGGRRSSRRGRADGLGRAR